MTDAESPRRRRERHHPEPARECPEVRGWPLLGSMPRIRREGMLPVLESEWKRLGDVFRVRLGPMAATFVAHPDAFERVLAGHKRTYVKGRAYDLTRRFLGDNLVTLEGDRWKQRRRLMQPYFHRAALEVLVATMVDTIEASMDDLRRRHPEGGRIDLHQEAVRITLEVVCTALFGPGVTRSDEIPYAILSDAVAVMNDKMSDPTPLWVPLPVNRRFRRVLGAVDDVVYRLIARARARKDTDPEIRSTLLGMLLEATDEDGRPLDDRAIRDEVITLYVAGHETTALTLTWLFALTRGRDDVLGRLRAEADALGGRRVEFADLASLTYMRQVIDETLRMRSPTAFLPRDATQDDNLCGVKVLEGDLVMLFVWGLHHHPDFWPDPTRFDPDRFTPEAKAERDAWSYAPFSGGPRVCIGNTFAIYEAQLILATMLSAATWEVEDEGPVVPVAEGTLRPERPIHVRFRWR